MKKNLLLSITILLSFTLAHSQEYFAKGSNVITGSINLGQSQDETKYDDYTTTTGNKTYGITGYYGRFIKDNLATGLSLGYNNRLRISNISYTDGTFQKNSYQNNYVRIGAFIKKFFPVSDKFGAYFNTQGGVSFDKNTQIRNDGASETKTENIGKGISLTAGLGIYYFVLNRLSLSLAIGQIDVYGSIDKSINDLANPMDSKRFNYRVNFVNKIQFDQFFTINFHF
jgi:hypothetical protein